MSQKYPKSISIYRSLQLRHHQLRITENRKFIDKRAKELREILDVPYFVGFIFDGETSLLASGNFPESDHFALIMDWLDQEKPAAFSGIALDVGAHVGFHTCLFSNYFKRIVSFEPHPFTHQLLRFNTSFFQSRSDISVEDPAGQTRASHHLGKVSIETFQLALTDFDGSAKIHVNKKNNLGATSLIQNAHDRSRHEFDVQCSRLDSISLSARISFMKVDIENSEYEFLLGARETILRDKPVIVMEDWESGNGGKSRAVSLLIELGYRVFLEPSIVPTRHSLLTKPIASLKKLTRNGFQINLTPIDFMSAKQGYQVMVCLPE